MTLTVRQLVLRVLLPFAAGYFLSYTYRTVNAVLAPYIAQAISLDAGAIGLMTGVYFLAFGAFQLPLGLLLDRYGPRRVEAALLLFAAAGAAAFALADSAGTLIAGRALVGLGVSSCLMAAIKANTQFFPPERHASMNGVILSSGGLGAVAATGPVQMALALTDWRGVYGGLAILTLGASALLFLTVPDKPAAAGAGGLGQQLREVWTIARDRRFLRVMPLSSISMGGFMAVQGLWAGPWLRDVAGWAPERVATGLTVMAAAMAVGFLSMGMIADRLARFGIKTETVGGFGMMVFWLGLVAMALGWTGAPLVLMAVMGFSGTSSSLMYAVVTRAFGTHMAGRATTSLNLVMFMAAFALQWGLGEVIGRWPKGPAGWPPEAFSAALAIPAVLTALAFLWFLRTARTDTQQ